MGQGSGIREVAWIDISDGGEVVITTATRRGAPPSKAGQSTAPRHI